MKEFNENYAGDILYHCENNGKRDDKKDLAQPYLRYERKIDTAKAVQHKHARAVKRQTRSAQKSGVNPFSVRHASEYQFDEPAGTAADYKQSGDSSQYFHMHLSFLSFLPLDRTEINYNIKPFQMQYAFTEFIFCFFHLCHTIFFYIYLIFLSLRYCAKAVFMV